MRRGDRKAETGVSGLAFGLSPAVDAFREFNGRGALDRVEEGDGGDEELPFGKPAFGLRQDLWIVSCLCVMDIYD